MTQRYVTDTIWTGDPVRSEVTCGRHVVYLASEIDPLLARCRAVLESTPQWYQAGAFDRQYGPEVGALLVEHCQKAFEKAWSMCRERIRLELADLNTEGGG